MNPVGLTRAEEEREGQAAPAPPQPLAPAGAIACVAAVPPDGKKCGAEARWLIVWRDPDAAKSPMCTECAKRIRAQAHNLGCDVGVEPIQRPQERQP